MYQPIILGSILLVTLYILKRMRSPKLNMPPLVRYKYPIIGHTYDFLTNGEEFFKQCRKEYGDIFSLYVWGEVRTFIGKEHFQEVLSRDDSFVFGKQVDIDSIFKHNIKFTNRPKEESQYEEVIVTFSELTIDTTKLLRIPPILNFIYPGLQAFINNSILSLGIYNPAINHQKVLIKHLKNQFCKRLQEKVKYGDSWKRPDDFIQNIMEEESFDPNNINYEEIADKLCLLIVVSVHTTANSCTHAIMNLASRPEYMQELYEEQLEVQKEADENGILPFEALNNMKKLDSFIKESFRLSEHVATLPHVTSKDYTFSNELQVPKDHSIYLYVDDIYLDESLQGPNPQSFEPFRHLNTNASASKVSKNYVVFGGGKHACPGRQLAVNEIKFLHNIILKYNLRTESGKIEGPKMIGTIKLPSNAGIIFEKRK
ncbi:cytochrome P450 [Rhizophagus irregularis DAOM 181602=DAOM 197198]|uniref:Cytochrome P450 n=1 Tax=Rhizophagus irregularis (strain DAOM 181602 / DAOM 197198 / MUCL 43194) TaxID=747089 RepID=A0A2P4QF29_RHIID|nr:cytochrome P450 [Rhizophagus irregularis DAOM 181602=DAOM 197198]POG76226.1 cytochrome P450 [Rhizophagus irregularis DAOM 181602=DAOM 197198]|eukprot:XP_025183092.1 cytochrome P450 [Rhizophagus irregularis DAOM 181602=DAOM 197198]